MITFTFASIRNNHVVKYIVGRSTVLLYPHTGQRYHPHTQVWSVVHQKGHHFHHPATYPLLQVHVFLGQHRPRFNDTCSVMRCIFCLAGGVSSVDSPNMIAPIPAEGLGVRDRSCTSSISQSTFASTFPAVGFGISTSSSS